LLHNAELLSAVNFLTTQLAYNKLKRGYFGLTIHSQNSFFFKIIRIYARCAPPTRTQVLRRRRHWLIAASTIDWSNCAHSSIRRVLSWLFRQLFCCLLFLA